MWTVGAFIAIFLQPPVSVCTHIMDHLPLIAKNGMMEDRKSCWRATLSEQKLSHSCISYRNGVTAVIVTEMESQLQ